MVQYQKLRKVGDDYEVTIPNELVERLSLREGALIAVWLEAVDESTSSPWLRELLERGWREHETGGTFLAVLSRENE